MASSDIVTLLSLDRYATIVGINPFFFNAAVPITLADGNTLFPMDNATNDLMPQYAWQDADKLSKEEIARQIANAEDDVTEYLHYFPAPTWVLGEVQKMKHHYRPELDIQINSRHGERGVVLNYGYFIDGGVRATTALSEQQAITYKDNDGDGWEEVAYMEIDVTGVTVSIDEVHIYETGNGAEPVYEIRHPKRLEIVGNTLYIEFWTWQMIPKSSSNALPTSNGIGVDISSPPTNVHDTVDVYRVYNDTTQDQVTFVTDATVDGSVTENGGYIYTRNPERGYVVPVKADYNSTEEKWDIAVLCDNPDYLKLNYYSGYRDKRAGAYGGRPANDLLNNDFARAITYIASARLPRLFSADTNTTKRLEDMMLDYMADENRSFVQAQILECPFGTRRGEVEGWKILQKYSKQMRTACL